MVHYIIIISTLLMMAVKVRAQCEKPAVGENRIINEETQQETYPEGSTIKFKCSVGFVPVIRTTSRSITCRGTQWSELELQCKKKSCGNPGDILNGKYLYQDTDAILFGAAITAECNKGYQLVGYAIRNCMDNGWDGRPPICEVVKCKPPSSIADGIFEPNAEFYDYNEIVTYSCDRGFTFFGQSHFVCSGDGSFQPVTDSSQPALPQCLRVSCEAPDILNAVRVEGKSPPYRYKDFVRYKCNSGYKMEGSDLLICTEKGWDPPPPQCAAHCEKPAVGEGQMMINASDRQSYREGSILMFRCSSGYVPIRASASKTIKCVGTQWSELELQCRKKSCGYPGDIPNGKYLFQLTEALLFGATISASCDEGYRLVGNPTRHCKENGWDGTEPVCEVITCERPEILNAEIDRKSPPYKYGDEVRVQCNKGYKMKGSALLTCKEKEWNPAPPQCTEVTCDEPKILNGFIIGDKSTIYRYKSSVQVQCNSEYKIDGSDHLTCEEKGWTPPPPTCHSNNHTKVIWMVVAVCVIAVAAAAAAIIYYLKGRKPKISNILANPENFTLVSSSLEVAPTEVSSPKPIPEPLRII